MRVEILEERLSTKDRTTGRLYVQVRGDIITVPDELGAKWCSLGWAKDVDGNVETGERIVRGARIEPHNVTHVTKVREN